MRVGKVNVGRPHGIETSHRSTKSGEGSSSQSECDARFGSLADISGVLIDVRFTPESGHRRTRPPCPPCATSGHQTNSIDHLVSKRGEAT